MTQEQIFEKYPDLYREKDLPMSETCMCWGLEVPEEWLPVIDKLSNTLTNTYTIGNGTATYRPKFTAKQVKIKFGELRFYFESDLEMIKGELTVEEKVQALRLANSYADGAIAMASQLCEGEPY